MKPSIIQERNAKQDAKINAILQARRTITNQTHFLPCLVEEEPKKHYYRGKVEPLYRIAYTIDAGRKLEKGEKLYKKCCTENCTEPTHFYSTFAKESEEAIQSIEEFFEDYQF